MTNPSLKEQLEALSLTSSTEVVENKKNPKVEAFPQKTKKSNTAWLDQARYGVELLRAYFSTTFKENKDIQPLKIGIKQDLVKQLSQREDIVVGDKACMVSSLAYYVNSLAYHKSVVAGASRIDLAGQAVGIVSTEEAKYSLDYRNTKLQKRKSFPGTKTEKSACN